MIRFRRPGFTVPTLAESGIGGLQRAQDRTGYETSGGKTFPSNFETREYWRRPDVRGFLYAMQGHICAYCQMERPLDVEHFRPKGKIEGASDSAGYWWLAYEGGNYFLACTACNSQRKGTKFPILAGGVRTTYETRAAIAQEPRLLLDPGEDDVEALFELNDDPTSPIVPASDLSQSQRERVQEVIAFFGLNLDPSIRRKRQQVYLEALRAIRDQRWEDVRAMAMRHREQSFAARFALRRHAPQYLPAEKDELFDLGDLLWQDLTTVLSELRLLSARGSSPRQLDRSRVYSLCWALVILQKDPELAIRLQQRMAAEPLKARGEILTAFRKAKAH